MPIGVSIDPFFTDTDLLPGTEYSYEVTAGDAASNESIPAGPLLASTSGAFVAAGDLWSYLDDGSNQGTAWRQPGFDTSAWAQGFAELGFGDGVEVTVLTSGFITYYFVKEFTVTGPLSADATLLIKRDDGVVVYINGTEAFRENMPGGTISYTTTASSTIAGLDEVAFIEGTLPTSLFSVGQNTIAVEIHQRSTGVRTSHSTLPCTQMSPRIRLRRQCRRTRSPPRSSTTPSRWPGMHQPTTSSWTTIWYAVTGSYWS